MKTRLGITSEWHKTRRRQTGFATSDLLSAAGTFGGKAYNGFTCVLPSGSLYQLLNSIRPQANKWDKQETVISFG